MFSPDTISLAAFYRTSLGKYVYRAMRGAIAKRWPECHEEQRYGDTMLIVGVGYTQPLLRPMLDARSQSEKDPNAPRSQPPICVMPASFGVQPWPRISKNGNKSFMCDEYELPFADHSVDRLVLFHMLELTEQPDTLMEEIWRVLKPSGKILAGVSNRRSMWARHDKNPFGYGRPFTIAQIETILEDARFTILGHERLLYVPPVQSKLLLKTMSLGSNLFKPITSKLPLKCFGGGVILIEAEKRTMAMIPAFKRERKLSLRGIRAKSSNFDTPSKME